MASTRRTAASSAAKKPAKPSNRDQVARFMDELDHPLEGSVVELRKLILGVDRRITEHIKWKAPSYGFDGDDRVTLNLHRRECILIVFHKGAKSKERKGNGPFFKDSTGLLEWLSDERAIVKLHSLEEVQQRKVKLRSVVKTWMALTSN